MSTAVAIPGWYLRALALYNRLSGTEWSVLLTIASHVWRTPGRAEVASLSLTRLHRHVRANEKSVHRAVRTLSTPAGQEYRYGERASNAKMGHGMVQVTRVGWASKLLPSRMRLVLDWRLWGWTGPLPTSNQLEPHPDVSMVAVVAARELHHHALLYGGTPPHVDLNEPAWLSWCETMDRLLTRGWTLADIQAALREAESDEYWRVRFADPDGAELLAEHLPGFLLRARKRVAQ